MIKFLSFYCLTKKKKKEMMLVCQGSAGKRYITDRLLAKDDSNHISEEHRNRLVIDAAEPGVQQWQRQRQQEEPPDSPSSAVDTDPSTSLMVGWLNHPDCRPAYHPTFTAAGRAKTRSRSHACSFYLPWMKPGTDSLWMALVPQERELHTELWGLELEEECFTSKRAATDRRKWHSAAS